MSLNIKDLIEHENKLTEIIEHAQKERGAIRLLINGIQMRNTSPVQDNTNGSGVATYKPRIGIAAFIRSFIDEKTSEWFTGRELTQEIMKSRIKTNAKKANLRATASNYLKQFYDRGILERENIGTSASPKFKYRKRSQQLEMRQ